MKYNFDQHYNRRNTNSLKYDFFSERGHTADELPLWVADMDFRTPDKVVEALHMRAEHGIFGYSEPMRDYFQTLEVWFYTRHNWRVNPEYFTLTCGVVFSLCALIRALTSEGDGVIICQPVYYPFEESIVENKRTLVVSELKYENGNYTVDFADFEEKIVNGNVKLFILCNPHNPVGRVWTKGELERMGDICLKHGVFVVSDEIHEDFVYAGNTHTVFANVKAEFEENCAVCTAPTKTFNLAGLHIANTYIKNQTVRNKFLAELNRMGYSQPNVMGMAACEAAYRCGADWLDSLKEYLAGNLGYVRERLEAIPQIKLVEPQGTYLVWLDCKGLGMTDEALSAFMRERAKLWLDDGTVFGKGGSGFERVNIACPRATLKEAMDRLERAVVEYENR